MMGQGIVLSLVMGLVTMVTSENVFRPPPLPMFKSVQVSTSENTRGAQIAVEYLAPEKPFALWYVDGLPVREKRMDYMVVNDFNQRGITIMSTLRDKRSRFGVCLLNVVGEICLFLRPLPLSAVIREPLHFPWPLMSPGPLYRYGEHENVKIHAPELVTPFNYTYSALLYSKDPDDAHGQLVMEATHGMDGGNVGDVVTIQRVGNNKTGWLMKINTNGSHYEGAMMVNTTFVTQGGVVQSCSLIRPFTVYFEDHRAAFPEGFVTPVPSPITWRCRLHVDCMVVCPFLSNGQVNVTVSRINPSIMAVLDTEELPAHLQGGEDEEWAVTRMLGPYFGYGAIFIPDFLPLRDAGTYKCTYKTQTTGIGIIALVVVK